MTLKYPGGVVAGGIPNFKPGKSVCVDAEKAPMLWSILLRHKNEEKFRIY